MQTRSDLFILAQQWLAVEDDFLTYWQGDLGHSTQQWLQDHAHLEACHRERQLLNEAIQLLLTEASDSQQWAAQTVLALYRRAWKTDQSQAPEDWLDWLVEQHKRGQICILPAEPDARITLIMPTYQRCETLKKAVASVLAQTDPDWILLIGDDHSTDETQVWCEQLAESDPRIYYLRHAQNGGFHANYNALCEAASTEWIAYMADDDILMPEWLSTVRRLIQRFPWVAMAGGGYYSLNFINGNLKAKQSGPHFIEDTVFDPQTELQRCAIEPPLVGGGLCVRRSVVQAISAKASLNRQLNYEGWDWWLIVQGLSRYEVAIAPEILLAYVNRTDTQQVSFTQDWGADFVRLCQQMVEQYERLFGVRSFPPELLRYQLEMVLEPNLVQSFRRAISGATAAELVAFIQEQQASWEGFRHLTQVVLPRCRPDLTYLISEQNVSGLTQGRIPGIESGQIRPELQTVIQAVFARA